MTVLLSLPAVVVTLCLVVIWFGIEARSRASSGGGIDLARPRAHRRSCSAWSWPG